MAALFAAAGLLSRFAFRHVETRWQIVAFAGAAAVYQLVLRPAARRRVSPASLGVDVVALTIAIVVTKFAVEGRVWP